MFEKLCDEISADFNLPRYIARKILLDFKKKLIAAVDAGEEFVISGLFSVKQKKTKAYKRINPFTKKPLEVPERFQTKFVPSKKIKYHALVK